MKKLTILAILGLFFSLNLPFMALAYEKKDINFGQPRVNTELNGTGATLNKTNSTSGPLSAVSQVKKQSAGVRKDYVEGEVLVKYKNSKINLQTVSGRTAALNFIRSKSLEKKEDLRKANISVLRIKDAKTVEQKIAELKNDPNVEYVQPNYQYYPSDINTNDTSRGLLWGLENTGQTIIGSYGANGGPYIPTTGVANADISGPEAWTISEATTSASVIVAVIDTGVAYNHPDLVANMWDGTACVGEDSVGVPLSGGCNHGYDYQDNDKTPLPTTSSHGTHIAGTIAAVKGNGLGIIGVAPQAKIMAIKSSLTTFDNVKSINFAKQNGAKIINASWGQYGIANNDAYDLALYNAIKDFPGLFITAAGNGTFNHDDGVDIHKHFPSYFKNTTSIGAGLNNIISVAATDQNDALATFSDYGAISVDVGAPGTNIYSTVPQETATLFESFESLTPPAIPSGWVRGGANNNWVVLDATGWLGSAWGNVLYGDLAFPYATSSDTTITSETYNLSSGGANIDFWAQCDTEYITDGWADYMQLEYSADGVNFSPAIDPYFGGEFRWDEATFDILNGENPLDSTGSSVFHYENISIPAQYLTGNFKFQFRWVANGNANTGNGDGCLIDDVKITKFSDGFDEKYDYLNGTSMAAPHVAGLAALVWGTKPTLTSADVKNSILNTGDPVSSLSTTTVTGKRINAFNALDSVTPPIISNVQIATTTATSTAVTWSTDLPATSKVAYSTTTPVSSTIISTSTLVTNHSLALTGLTASTTYYFYTESADTYGNIATSTEQSFTTLSIPVTLSSIAITTPADKLSYTVGEGLDITGLVVTGTYSDSSTQVETITADNISGFDSSAPVEDQVLTITVGGQTTAYTVDIVAATVTDTTAPSISSYTLNGSGQDVTFNPNDPASVSIVINADEPVKFTRIKILNSSSTEVKFFTQSTDFVTTASKTWNGKNAEGVVVPDGVYTIQVNIKDAADNISSNLNLTPHAITVDTMIPVEEDTTSPVIESHGDVTAEATSSAGAEVAYASPNATDNVDATGPAICEPISGSSFPIGTTAITCNKTDASGNIATSTAFDVIVQDTTPPEITIIGNAVIDLSVSDAYSEEGATAADIVDGSLEVQIDNSAVDTSQPGSYTVTYDVSDAAGNQATQVTRTVSVSDAEAPVITSTSDITEEATGPDGASVTYDESALTATDDVDGTISVDGGSCTPASGSAFAIGTTVVTCSATDSSGNEGNGVAFSVTIEDTTAPEVTLIGSVVVELIVGDLYSDAGASALDIVDGDITENIVTSGNAETSTAGTYIIAYNVSDAAGNATPEVTRTVNVSVAEEVDEGGDEEEEDEDEENTVVPDEDGNATLNNTISKVVITDPDQAVNITITDDTEDPTIDVSAFITDDGIETTGILPEITINSDVADVVIPDNTTVTGPAGWNGIINAPTVGTPDGDAPAGFSVGGTVISIGSSLGTLVFSEPVTILLEGVTGTVGYKPALSDTWQIITNVCDNYDNPSEPPAGSECTISNGTDTKIVTFHFTEFGELDPIPTSTSSSGRIGSRAGDFNRNAFIGGVTGQVLGAFTPAERMAQIATVKVQLSSLIRQLIGLLQAQLITALQAEIRNY